MVVKSMKVFIVLQCSGGDEKNNTQYAGVILTKKSFIRQNFLLNLFLGCQWNVYLGRKKKLICRRIFYLNQVLLKESSVY